MRECHLRRFSTWVSHVEEEDRPKLVQVTMLILTLTFAVTFQVCFSQDSRLSHFWCCLAPG